MGVTVKTLTAGQSATIGDDITIEVESVESGGARLKVVITERERYPVRVQPRRTRDADLSESARD